MAQFDVFRNPRAGLFPLLLDVQHELLFELATRVVVPLMTLKRYRAKPITRLNPIANVRDTEYVLVFQEIAAVPRSVLKEPVESLAARRREIIGALDLLFTGI
jgi:toxin CcdB